MQLKTLTAGLALATLIVGSAFADCTLAPDATAGKAVSNQCKSCHVLEAGKPSRPTAPNLHDAFGEHAASRKDFKYSEAMMAAGDKGLVWDDKTLFDYVADPKVFLTKFNGSELKNLMFFHLPDEQKRKDMIAFLKAIKGKADCN